MSTRAILVVVTVALSSCASLPDPAARDVLARAEIRELVERYHAGVNRRDFALLESVFAPDAVWEVGAPVSLRTEGRALILQKLHETIGQQEFLVQLVSAVVIDRLESDRAVVHSTIVELGRERDSGKGMQVVGQYDDDVVRIDGQWKYARHAMRVQWMSDAPLPGTIVAP